MYSTFHGLEVGKRAILSQQTALNTTGHNIANANTKGYTRQEAVMQATRPLAFPSMNNGTLPMQLGTGVEISQLKRIRNQFLDLQFRNEQQKLGEYEAKSTVLSNLEAVFNEPSDYGLDMALNRFWQSMQELAKKPDSLSARTVVLANAQAIATNFSEISTGISLNQQNVATQLSDKAKEINASLVEVAALNNQIALTVASGNQPNDLFDKRDLLIDSLSKQMGVQVTPGQNGMIDLTVGGVQLVSGITSSAFGFGNGEVMVDNTAVAIEVGELKGLIDSQNALGEFQSKIDFLAQAIAEQLNAIHASDDARNLDDIKNQNPTPDKLPFFVSKDPNKPLDASNIILNPLLANSPEKIASALSNFPGDSSNAVKMMNLKDKEISIGTETTTIGAYYHMILGDIGTRVQNAESFRGIADARQQQIDMQRQSVSGVSIDEEMTNMVRYQQAYNAAAKYVSAVNEMLDKLINGMV